MDASSHRLANLLVGNAAGAATLEVTLVGPELSFECDARIAISGAEFAVTAGGTAIALHAPCDVRAGATLRFGPRVRGARAYLAVDGGIDVRPILGSRATHVVSKMGGVDGRRLQEGDVLPIGPPVGARRRAAGDSRSICRRTGRRSACSWSPHTDAFADAAVQFPAGPLYGDERIGSDGVSLEGPGSSRAPAN
jgi:allophanate hydrolase subunit 2